jgi:peptidoglycan lytic transglycosylase
MSRGSILVGYMASAIFLLSAGTQTANPQGPRPKRLTHMISSFYGPGFEGRMTASGVPFHSKGLTAAHRTLPFGTLLRLTNPTNQKTVTVRVTDRGPYREYEGIKRFNGHRDLDVSEGAARELGFVREGVTTLIVQLISPVAP